jgi:sugar phosphate isomerase/epimerase
LTVLSPGCAPSPGAPAREGARRAGLAHYFGCEPLDHLGQLKGWGFDYAEVALSKVAAMPEAEFGELLARVRAAGVPVEAANFFVPGEVRLCGPEADPAGIREYVERSLARAERLGVRVVVFGSGTARRIPEGFPREAARGQLRDFARLCAAEIGRQGYGLKIAVEPLPPSVTNVLLTLRETLDFVRSVDDPRIGLLFDYDNMMMAGDDPGALAEAGDLVLHVHVADGAHGAGFPAPGKEDPRLVRAFALLRRTGYRGRVSLEAGVKDAEADLKAGLALVRRLDRP